MSDKYKMPFEGMDWSEMQKQFFEAFTKYNQPSNPFATSPFSTSAFSPQTNNWSDAMDLWWQAFKPDAAPASNNVFNKMLQQAKTYFMLSEQFSKLYQGMEQSKKNTDDFVHFLNEQFQNIESVIAENHQLFSWSNFIDQCEKPAELLNNLATNTPLFSGEVINDFSPEMRKLRERFLTTPSVGYSRESQDKLQEAIRLWANYQDNYQEFHAVMSKLNHDALGRMRKKLLKMHKAGEKVESMRQVYNIWVESNEKVYGEFVFTDEYADMNARLVNSLMAFKNKSHEITEDYLSSMNLPTSGAIDALERRQHELRKQVKTLTNELKSLQTQLKQQKQTPAAQPAAEKTTEKAVTSAAKPRTAKRKTKAKKKSAKKSSKVVDFKKSKRAKQKKQQVKSGQSRSKQAENAEDKQGMIEIKF